MGGGGGRPPPPHGWRRLLLLLVLVGCALLCEGGRKQDPCGACLLVRLDRAGGCLGGERTAPRRTRVGTTGWRGVCLREVVAAAAGGGLEGVGTTEHEREGGPACSMVPPCWTPLWRGAARLALLRRCQRPCPAGMVDGGAGCPASIAGCPKAAYLGGPGGDAPALSGLEVDAHGKGRPERETATVNTHDRGGGLAWFIAALLGCPVSRSTSLPVDGRTHALWHEVGTHGKGSLGRETANVIARGRGGRLARFLAALFGCPMWTPTSLLVFGRTRIRGNVPTDALISAVVPAGTGLLRIAQVGCPGEDHWTLTKGGWVSGRRRDDRADGRQARCCGRGAEEKGRPREEMATVIRRWTGVSLELATLPRCLFAPITCREGGRRQDPSVAFDNNLVMRGPCIARCPNVVVGWEAPTRIEVRSRRVNPRRGLAGELDSCSAWSTAKVSEWRALQRVGPGCAPCH